MKWILAALILSVGFMTGCQCSERPGQGTDMDTPAEEQGMPMDETGDGMGDEPGMGDGMGDDMGQDSVPTTEDEPVDAPMEEEPMEEEPTE